MDNDFNIESPYLSHYGIKGMKWGVRRYQNEDGTLTAAGKRRVKRALRKRDKALEYDIPKKTYKKAAKVKKLTATLKDQTGKVIKSKKVTFTVNGKKYTAKTNKKGVATVKVKLSRKKTYKVTVKFAGDKTYYAVKKTGKVVIK